MVAHLGKGTRTTRDRSQGHPVNPVGATYSVTSGDLRILMDQPTQPIPSLESPSRHDDR
jgi:hypothetical protein